MAAFNDDFTIVLSLLTAISHVVVSVWSSIIYVYLDNTMTASTIQIILLITFVNLGVPDDYDYYHGDRFDH